MLISLEAWKPPGGPFDERGGIVNDNLFTKKKSEHVTPH